MLPQYSGGLGILAGDHLKAASDLGVPIVGVGLLYRHGYFRQSLSRDGWQQETLPGPRPRRAADLPAPRRRRHRRQGHASACPATSSLTARIWVAQVGRVPLLLLDSDVEENSRRAARRHRPAVRRQHRAPAAPGDAARHRRRPGDPRLHPDHRRARPRGVPHQRGPRRLPRPRADPRAHREAPRASTSTPPSRSPAPARSSPPTPRCRPASTGSPRDLVAQYFGGDNACPGVPVDRILALGAEDYDGGDPAVFNMAVMGFRLAQRANGVSQLHGEVSRGMFGGLWPAVRRRRAADHLDHQRRARADLGGPRGLRPRPQPRRASRPRPRRRPARAGLRGRRQGARRRRSGRPSASCASGSSPTPAGGCASRGSSAARRRPS